MPTTFFCPNKCCTLKTTPYIDHFYVKQKKSNIKAGAFIYDKNKEKILLVQSKGNFWGIPKGTLEENEKIIHCAKREVLEETGIIIDENDFLNEIILYNKAYYYVLNMDECDVNVQTSIKNNDANGIAWINISCLKQMIHNNTIILNKHTILLLQKILKIQI